MTQELRHRFRHRNVAAIVAAAALSIVLAGSPTLAGVLDRIAEDGFMRAGTRASAAPFAQKTATGEFVGFSVDLLGEFRASVERSLGRAVTLELYEVTPADRLQRVAAGELDIVCGITTPTWDREELVDFSLPFFRDGTRIMVHRQRAHRGIDFSQFEVGVVEGTTTVGIVEANLPTATLRIYPNMGAAMQGLEAGEVDGVSNVGVVLLGLAASAEPRRSVVLVPRTRPLATETLACVLPQDDSPWRDLVNRTLVDMLHVHENNFESRYEEIYDRWFGRNGTLYYPLDQSTRDYLSNLSIWMP